MRHHPILPFALLALLAACEPGERADLAIPVTHAEHDAAGQPPQYAVLPKDAEALPVRLVTRAGENNHPLPSHAQIPADWGFGHYVAIQDSSQWNLTWSQLDLGGTAPDLRWSDEILLLVRTPKTAPREVPWAYLDSRQGIHLVLPRHQVTHQMDDPAELRFYRIPKRGGWLASTTVQPLADTGSP